MKWPLTHTCKSTRSKWSFGFDKNVGGQRNIDKFYVLSFSLSFTVLLLKGCLLSKNHQYDIVAKQID